MHEDNVEWELKEDGFDFEVLKRHGRLVFLIYRDAYPIGSIELDDMDDTELWNMILTKVKNEKEKLLELLTKMT